MFPNTTGDIICDADVNGFSRAAHDVNPEGLWLHLVFSLGGFDNYVILSEAKNPQGYEEVRRNFGGSFGRCRSLRMTTRFNKSTFTSAHAPYCANH